MSNEAVLESFHDNCMELQRYAEQTSTEYDVVAGLLNKLAFAIEENEKRFCETNSWIVDDDTRSRTGYPIGDILDFLSDYWESISAYTPTLLGIGDANVALAAMRFLAITAIHDILNEQSTLDLMMGWLNEERRMCALYIHCMTTEADERPEGGTTTEERTRNSSVRVRDDGDDGDEQLCVSTMALSVLTESENLADVIGNSKDSSFRSYVSKRFYELMSYYLSNVPLNETTFPDMATLSQTSLRCFELSALLRLYDGLCTFRTWSAILRREKVVTMLFAAIRKSSKVHLLHGSVTVLCLNLLGYALTHEWAWQPLVTSSLCDTLLKFPSYSTNNFVIAELACRFVIASAAIERLVDVTPSSSLTKFVARLCQIMDSSEELSRSKIPLFFQSAWRTLGGPSLMRAFDACNGLRSLVDNGRRAVYTYKQLSDSHDNDDSDNEQDAPAPDGQDAPAPSGPEADRALPRRGSRMSLEEPLPTRHTDKALSKERLEHIIINVCLALSGYYGYHVRELAGFRGEGPRISKHAHDDAHGLTASVSRTPIHDTPRTPGPGAKDKRSVQVLTGADSDWDGLIGVMRRRNLWRSDWHVIKNTESSGALDFILMALKHVLSSDSLPNAIPLLECLDVLTLFTQKGVICYDELMGILIDLIGNEKREIVREHSLQVLCNCLGPCLYPRTRADLDELGPWTSVSIPPVDDDYNDICAALRLKDGIFALSRALVYDRPVESVDRCRSLAVACMWGLCRSDDIRRLLKRFPLLTTLPSMLAGPVMESKAKYHDVFVLGAMNLMAELARPLSNNIHVPIPLGQALAHVNATSLDRSLVDNYTSITYQDDELMLLIMRHLQDKGYSQTVAQLQQDMVKTSAATVSRSDDDIQATTTGVRRQINEQESARKHARIDNGVGHVPDMKCPSVLHDISLDSIIKQYLLNEHKQCAVPTSVVPKVSLFEKHHCDSPSYGSVDISKRSISVSLRNLELGSRSVARRTVSHGLRFSNYRRIATISDDDVEYNHVDFLDRLDSMASCTNTGELHLFSVSRLLNDTKPVYKLSVTVQSGINNFNLYNKTNSDKVLCVMDTDSALVLGKIVGRLTDADMPGGGPSWESVRSWETPDYVYSDPRFNPIDPSRILVMYNNWTQNTTGFSLLDTETGVESLSVRFPSMPAVSNNCGWSVDGGLVLCGHTLYDARQSTQRVIHTFDKLSNGSSLAFHPAGHTVAVDQAIWDLRTFRLLHLCHNIRNSRGLLFSKTGDALYSLPSENENDFTVVAVPGYHQLTTVRCDGPLDCLAVDDNDRYVTGVLDKPSRGHCVAVYGAGLRADEELTADEDELTGDDDVDVQDLSDFYDIFGQGVGEEDDDDDGIDIYDDDDIVISEPSDDDVPIVGLDDDDEDDDDDIIIQDEEHHDVEAPHDDEWQTASSDDNDDEHSTHNDDNRRKRPRS